MPCSGLIYFGLDQLRALFSEAEGTSSPLLKKQKIVFVTIFCYQQWAKQQDGVAKQLGFQPQAPPFEASLRRHHQDSLQVQGAGWGQARGRFHGWS